MTVFKPTFLGGCRNERSLIEFSSIMSRIDLVTIAAKLLISRSVPFWSDAKRKAPVCGRGEVGK